MEMSPHLANKKLFHLKKDSYLGWVGVNPSCHPLVPKGPIVSQTKIKYLSD